MGEEKAVSGGEQLDTTTNWFWLAFFVGSSVVGRRADGRSKAKGTRAEDRRAGESGRVSATVTLGCWMMVLQDTRLAHDCLWGSHVAAGTLSAVEG